MSYSKLRIYKLSLDGVGLIHELTQKVPVNKNYALRDQIRRASMSVCANIAEGCGRRSKKDISRFLTMSIGSVNEVKAHLDIIDTIYKGKISIKKEKSFYEKLGKQIWTFRKTLDKK